MGPGQQGVPISIVEACPQPETSAPPRPGAEPTSLHERPSGLLIGSQGTARRLPSACADPSRWNQTVPGPDAENACEGGPPHLRARRMFCACRARHRDDCSACGDCVPEQFIPQINCSPLRSTHQHMAWVCFRPVFDAVGFENGWSSYIGRGRGPISCSPVT